MKSQITWFSVKILGLSLLLVSCDSLFNGNKDGDKPDLGDSLDPIEEVILIEEATNSTLTVNVNSKKEAYFSIDFTNISSNTIINNGIRDAWCIDVWKSINSNNGVYHNIKLYSTDLVEQWKPLNYLLNIEKRLRDQDPDVSWLEIQLVIWSLRAYPKFDLDSAKLEDLPGQFRSNGQPTFNTEKVKEILNIVDANYQDFNYQKSGVKFAVIGEMPVDVQTIITVVERE